MAAPGKKRERGSRTPEAADGRPRKIPDSIGLVQQCRVSFAFTTPQETLQPAACILTGYGKKYHCVRPGQKSSAVWAREPQHRAVPPDAHPTIHRNGRA